MNIPHITKFYIIVYILIISTFFSFTNINSNENRKSNEGFMVFEYHSKNENDSKLNYKLKIKLTNVNISFLVNEKNKSNRFYTKTSFLNSRFKVDLDPNEVLSKNIFIKQRKY